MGERLGDGLPVVGMGPTCRPLAWSGLSLRERAELEMVAAGDVVDVLLDDGRIVRTTAKAPLIERGMGRLVQRWFFLDGIRGCYAAERVRRAGGWRHKAGVTMLEVSGG